MFRSVSYFKHYEDEQIRGDKYDGTRLYAKKEGLTITKKQTGETFKIPLSFESSIKTDDIFVFCMSAAHDDLLYEKFKADVCAEIIAVDKFISRISNAVKRRPTTKPRKLLHGAVDYYPEEEPPIIDWALPERIVMLKLHNFEWQKEYRLAFSIRNALSLGKTTQSLVSVGAPKEAPLENYPSRTIHIGSIEDIIIIHKRA